MREFISNDKLKEIVKTSLSWSQVIKTCGGKIGGGSYQYYQTRIRKLGFDTSHFLGQSAHTGFRHTGIGKKQHWNEVLRLRTTKDREKSKVIRRAYFEYCQEKSISICCVECKNTGTWKGKSLRLQINHKDECRWNNVPENLEWLCPNCHDIKTIYKGPIAPM